MATFKVRYFKISVQLKPQCTIYYTSKKCFLLEKLLSVALYLFFSSDCILQILMFKQLRLTVMVSGYYSAMCLTHTTH